MSFPYLSDFLNYVFGTELNIPIAMFGTFVVLGLLVATFIAKLEVQRYGRLDLLPKVVERNGIYQPTNQMISDLVVVCAIFGIAGARFFHILDYPTQFLSDPLGMIFTRSGFSIYGGLVFGLLAGIVFVKRHGLPIMPMLDAVAPSIILGYGIGRIGCQVSGDGDWGVLSEMSLKPNWLPDWFWAQTYENNIAGVIIPDPGVYPTPIYEASAALLIFLFLWSIRKLNFRSGHLFSIYLLLSGFQRLLIEKIRINKELFVFDYSFTQAELISTLVIITGLIGFLATSQVNKVPKIAFTIAIFGTLTACVSL